MTETDQRCETVIIEMIRARFPNDLVIGEEGTAAGGGGYELTDANTWIIGRSVCACCLEI